MVATTRSRVSAKLKADVPKMCTDGMKTDEKKPRYPRKRASTRPAQSRQRQGDARSDGNGQSMSARPSLSDKAEIIPAPRYKSDLCESAFFGCVARDQDHLSPVPAEVLYHIFDYCVLDHHPERARLEHSLDDDFKANPHVLVSLAAMSRHFRGLVEDFSRRFLTKHGAFYGSSVQVDALKLGRRRSERIAASGISSNKVFRMELVTAIRERCIQCGLMSDHYAIMSNGVACHPQCELRAFPGLLVNLTDAMHDFDLRDYMLLKSRVPGPRAKHVNLPSIPYGTIWTRMGFGMRSGLAYRFNRLDVERIARLVHGDVDAHMARKRQERVARYHKKRKAVWIALKTRHHTDNLQALPEGTVVWKYHQKALANVDRRSKEGDDIPFHECIHHTDYGDYDDIHMRVCAVEPCEDCQDERFLRYLPWLR